MSAAPNAPSTTPSDPPSVPPSDAGPDVLFNVPSDAPSASGSDGAPFDAGSDDAPPHAGSDTPSDAVVLPPAYFWEIPEYQEYITWVPVWRSILHPEDHEYFREYARGHTLFDINTFVLKLLTLFEEPDFYSPNWRLTFKQGAMTPDGEEGLPDVGLVLLTDEEALTAVAELTDEEDAESELDSGYGGSEDISGPAWPSESASEVGSEAGIAAASLWEGEVTASEGSVHIEFVDHQAVRPRRAKPRKIVSILKKVLVALIPCV
ncbi:hypothetical protein BV25DRAFT_1921719 [Artomyces pyxidatus]|uniref:Uncharacterized protein n=1 Tax=Artomyces pyxidatus TaxID=48021 RepID=A0ACB8SGS7_9AGAM|nr:hypothetical protein BV25DRAFT_1921719 [Artomyces pyxidatus]